MYRWTGHFHDSRLKLKRARAVAAELENELAKYGKEAEANPPVYTSWNPTPDENIPETPELISALLGDVLHNCRAALDQMAGELIKKSGNDPKGAYFPIAKSSEAFSQSRKDSKFKLSGEDAVELLKTFNPYAGGNNILWGLHELNIQDKHRHVISHSVGGRVKTELHFDHAGNLSKTLVTVTPTCNFGDQTPFGDVPILPKLDEIISQCEMIVEQFKSLLDLRSPTDRPEQP